MNRNTIFELFADDEAVAPVIAVILMVAITVVLAAVIGGFVIGVGSKQGKAPQTTLSFEYNHTAGTVTVVHDGGQELDASTISVEESGSTDGVSKVTGTDRFTAGDVVADGSYETGEDISVVWMDPESKTTKIIGESTAPA